jgi:hypothetical protein
MNFSNSSRGTALGDFSEVVSAISINVNDAVQVAGHLLGNAIVTV